MAPAIPLEGLYFHLMRAGIPLSVRDFEDALAALRQGYGTECREELHWLCETLWARTDQEVLRVARLFRDFPRPTPEQVAEISRADSTEDRSDVRRPRKSHPRRPRPSVPTPVVEEPQAVEFVPPTQSGVGLPRAHLPARASEAFIMTPRPLVTLRSFIIAWRRFRIAQRSGAKVELDVDATIAEQSRRGTLIEPVLIPARRNQARLVVLVDASPSMVTWKSTMRLLSESLGSSQLAQASVYYFDNAPDDVLHASASLIDPAPIATVAERHGSSALIVASDAGATRGAINRERIRQVRTFVTATHSAWHPVAWLNPLPRARWKGTSAAHIAAIPGLAMFELTDDGLTLAVDYLRGRRAGET